MNIVWLESESISVPLPRPEVPHRWVEYPYTAPNEVIERVVDADILIVNKVKVTEEVLQAAPKLKMVQLTATGKDNVDAKACESRGIVVRNVVNYGPQAVAEHAFACLLQLVRRVPEWQALVAEGEWSKSKFFCLHNLPMRSLNEMTLGILGKGAIGEKLAEYAKAFGMKVLYLDRPDATSVRPGYVPFNEGLEMIDALSLHCPLNENTQGLISDKVLSAMKQGSVLINTARGGLVNFAAVKQALESGHLHGAALDVLEVEPPPSDHPMLVWQHPRLIITPHVAWGTKQAQSNLAKIAIEQVEEFIKSTT